MKTKLEKEIEWIKEQGYPGDKITLVCLYNYADQVSTRRSETPEHVVSQRVFSKFLGVVKDGKMIQIPEFEDDKEMPVDEYLVKYTSSPECSSSLFNALKEIDGRMKVLEAKVKQLEKFIL